LRSLLFSDADAVFERPTARYVRFSQNHRGFMALSSLTSIGAAAIAWSRLGLHDAVALLVIIVLVCAIVLLPYMAIRAAIRRLSGSR